MALVSTTIASAITASDLNVKVSASTSLAIGKFVQIDNELCGPIVSFSGVFVQLRGRGAQGTAAVAHNALSYFTFGDPSDFPNAPAGLGIPIPPSADDFVTYSVNGAIAIPDKDTTIALAKATLAAMTIVNPDVTQNGRKLRIIAATGTAHTLTGASATAFNGTTGTATWAAAIGGTLELTAVGGKWASGVQRGVTLA